MTTLREQAAPLLELQTLTTKGPWAADGYGHEIQQLGQAGREICQLYAYSDDAHVANAAFIAAVHPIADFLRAALDENDRLRAGLIQSVNLQSHYASLLNSYDAGKRIVFKDERAWLERLAALAQNKEKGMRMFKCFKRSDHPKKSGVYYAAKADTKHLGFSRVEWDGQHWQGHEGWGDYSRCRNMVWHGQDGGRRPIKALDIVERP